MTWCSRYVQSGPLLPKSETKNEKNKSCDTIAICRDSLSHAHARVRVFETSSAAAQHCRVSLAMPLQSELRADRGAQTHTLAQVYLRAVLRGVTTGQWGSINIKPSGGNWSQVDSRGAAVGVWEEAVLQNRITCSRQSDLTMHTEKSSYCSEMPDHSRFCPEMGVRTIKPQMQIGEVGVFEFSSLTITLERTH